jgi:hypothetical protein
MFRERDNKDWLRLGLSTIHMSESLKTADAARKGFCGQYLAGHRPSHLWCTPFHTVFTPPLRYLAEFPADDGAVCQLNLTPLGTPRMPSPPHHPVDLPRGRCASST